jgi:hypothetical protein
MSQLSRGIFGVLAVSLTFGAAQLAVGRDLAEKTQDQAASSEAINRTAKGDRAGGAADSASAPTRTISLRLDALADTSVLIRLPVKKETDKEARNNVPPPTVVKPQTRKRTVACEPPVSVLTEVAKRLEPGRCIT